MNSNKDKLMIYQSLTNYFWQKKNSHNFFHSIKKKKIIHVLCWRSCQIKEVKCSFMRGSYELVLHRNVWGYQPPLLIKVVQMHVLWWHVANIPTGCSVSIQVRDETNESKLQASPQPAQITCQRCVPSGHSYWPPGCQQLVPAASLSSAAGTDDRNTPHKTDHAVSHALETVDKATMCIGTCELSCSLCNVLMKSFSVLKTNLNTFSLGSFTFLAPSVWNSLPADLRNAPSLACFRSQLKTHLFCLAFN